MYSWLKASEICKMHITCKNIQNIQSRKLVVVSYLHVYKDIKLHKHSHKLLSICINKTRQVITL